MWPRDTCRCVYTPRYANQILSFKLRHRCQPVSGPRVAVPVPSAMLSLGSRDPCGPNCKENSIYFKVGFCYWQLRSIASDTQCSATVPKGAAVDISDAQASGTSLRTGLAQSALQTSVLVRLKFSMSLLLGFLIRCPFN